MVDHILALLTALLLTSAAGLTVHEIFPEWGYPPVLATAGFALYVFRWHYKRQALAEFKRIGRSLF